MPSAASAPAAAHESRAERKEQTRRAILDAALQLCEDSSLVALSLRQVAREVGIVPTGFYRHFASIEQLGLALVDESFVSLRAALRDVRLRDPAPEDRVDASIAVLVEQVHAQPDHVHFLVRERAAGPPAVREAIRHRIALLEADLAADLALLPVTARWSEREVRLLAGLVVTTLSATAADVVGAEGDPGAEHRIVEDARTQLGMLLVGASSWRSGT